MGLGFKKHGRRHPRRLQRVSMTQIDRTEHCRRIVLERARGDTFGQIGERHGISYQRVQTIVRDARRSIDKLELDLLKATKTGELPALLVPNQDQEDRQTALSYLQWCVDQLRARDVEVKVAPRSTPEGMAFILEDVTPYGGTDER